jgi:hypothetical protein
VTLIPIQVGDIAYALDPQPVRISLSDEPPMLFGFQVHVLRGEELVGIKTCFVGRVSVQVRDPAALAAPMEGLSPVLYELAAEKIRLRLEEGEAGDEIVFA